MVEKLLPFLDLDSTLHLAQTHRVTRELLKKSFVWNKLIRRSCPSHDGKDFHDFTPSHDEKMSTVLSLEVVQDPSGFGDGPVGAHLRKV